MTTYIVALTDPRSGCIRLISRTWTPDLFVAHVVDRAWSGYGASEPLNRWLRAVTSVSGRVPLLSVLEVRAGGADDGKREEAYHARLAAADGFDLLNEGATVDQASPILRRCA
jgi:hypothetical protein